MSNEINRTPQILVTGATGNVGKEVVTGLREQGIPFRVGLYDLTSYTPTSDDALIEAVSFDFLNPSTYASAFEGIKNLFLIRPPALSNVARDIAPAIQAAIEAGVEHIVFLSLQGVENNRITPHYKIEQLIMESGIAYTFLRASFFMQNLSTTQAQEIREQDKIALPVGKAKTSFIDVRDIAAVAVEALIDPRHRQQKYTLTGGEALDYTQIANKLSVILGRPIRYSNPSLIQFVWRQLTTGHALAYTLVVAGLYTITRFGNASEVTQEVEAILGRKPISFDQFANDYRHCWQA